MKCPSCETPYERVISVAEAAPSPGPFAPSPAPPMVPTVTPPPLPTETEMPVNPYAPPKSALRRHQDSTSGLDEVWRDGPKLIMRRTATLPQRCIHCNGRADRFLPRKLYWHAPVHYLWILVSLLLYAIVALIVRKRADVVIPLCHQHDKKRKTGIAVGWLGGLGGFVLIIVGAVNDSAGLILFSVLAMLVSLIAGIAMARVVIPAKIDDRFVWLKKISPEYLNRLPPAPVNLF